MKNWSVVVRKVVKTEICIYNSDFQNYLNYNEFKQRREEGSSKKYDLIIETVYTELMREKPVN